MPTPAQKIKIIITDDHRIYRQGVKLALAAKTDIEFIAEAENGQDLLDKLEYLQPDMVTIGIQMPVMNGLETIPILKTKYPALKIIVISMVNDSSMICRVMQLGANAYLTKSASSAEIYEAILACRNSWLFINNTLRGALLETAPENIIKGGFNERELHIMRLLQQGKTIPELSAALNLGERTINAIIDRLFTKTNSNTIAGVLQYAMEKGNNLSQTD